MPDLTTRRRLLTAGAAIPLFSGSAEGAPPSGEPNSPSGSISLNGRWQFRLDSDPAAAGWAEVDVPHTWQIETKHTGYRGIAWYRRDFEAPGEWRDRVVRVEFEAVFHTATVWVNDKEVGNTSAKATRRSPSTSPVRYAMASPTS